MDKQSGIRALLQFLKFIRHVNTKIHSTQIWMAKRLGPLRAGVWRFSGLLFHSSEWWGAGPSKIQFCPCSAGVEQR